MKVDRIVGQERACCGEVEAESEAEVTMSAQLRELVDRRAIYYDPWFDFRVWPKVRPRSNGNHYI